VGHVEDFRTHANYLRAFAMLCVEPYAVQGSMGPWGAASLAGSLSQLAPLVAASPSMTRTLNAPPDLIQAQASLTNAWGTELLLAFGHHMSPEEDLVRLMNNWAVVQAYYVGYHATQALVVSRGQPRPDSHPKTQAQFATLWADRTVSLPPWSLGSASRGGWKNAPAFGIQDDLNSWSTCDSETCWHLAAKALRTTRSSVLKDRIGAVQQRKYAVRRRESDEAERRRLVSGKEPWPAPAVSRPRLTVDEKIAEDAKLRTYTVLDYLYRLRVKTNYQDAAMFLDGPEDQLSSARVHRDLVALASSTMLAHELHVGALVGGRRLLEWVDSWLTRNGVSEALGLGLRRDVLARHLV
jgi:hypothetical protein